MLLILHPNADAGERRRGILGMVKGTETNVVKGQKYRS